MMRVTPLLVFLLAVLAQSAAAWSVPRPPLATPPRRSTNDPPLAHMAVATALVVAITAAPASAADGVAVFQANCAGCHAGGQNFMTEKKTLQKAALEQYQSLDPIQLEAFVRDKMPHVFLPFHGMPDEDFKAVVDYVVDQAVNDKW